MRITEIDGTDVAERGLGVGLESPPARAEVRDQLLGIPHADDRRRHPVPVHDPIECYLRWLSSDVRCRQPDAVNEREYASLAQPAMNRGGTVGALVCSTPLRRRRIRVILPGQH